MAPLLQRPKPAAPQLERGSARSGPVVLATLAVRVEPVAERVATEAALEAGVKLILASMLTLPPLPMTLMMARENATLPHEEDLEAVRATAQRAAALGLDTELLRITSPRPVTALLELVGERSVGLLVFGPDRSRISKRRFRAAAKAVRRDAGCLVWITPDG